MKSITQIFLSVFLMIFSNNIAAQASLKSLDEATIIAAADALNKQFGVAEKDRIDKGVRQCAALWKESDGSGEDFIKFCTESFVPAGDKLQVLFEKLSANYENLNGFFNSLSIELKRPLHLNLGEITQVDELFGAYEPGAHVSEDFFENKIAFVVILNFPFYTLEEKNTLGSKWTSLEWAYARMGDLYTARIPAEIILKSAQAMSNADNYISSYNIYMSTLLDSKGQRLFPEDLVLITHWGLRDELKACYNAEKGLEKQRIIYEVMKRIIDQSIPEAIINSKDYTWNPYLNKLYKNQKEVAFKSESNTRYQYLLNNFLAMKKMDAFCPGYPTAIMRAFDQGLEMSQTEVEKLFIDYISSPQVKKVAALISKRLGRKLEPFDIWYDGFKPRSSILPEELDKAVIAKYPTKEAFEKDLPEILIRLGFSKDKAQEVTSHIVVDASRGAGHAWGSEMKKDVAHLRTRFTDKGMNYKGYNIAVHEFGHTVEQTISLHEVDYYMLRGVPNTAFTEALAFVFQKRDLELLGIKDDNQNKFHLMALDNFWGNYEIMGVSLVDMYVWKWLYAHPTASATELKDQVILIAKDVWNKYYAPVFGVKDQPVLAIYSHMIDYPLYLSAYPLGHLIEFQLEKQLQGKNFASEIGRIYKQGRLTPQIWMKRAVGSEISNKPILDAVDEALLKVGK